MAKFKRTTREEIRSMFTPEDFITRPDYDNAEGNPCTIEDALDEIARNEPGYSEARKYQEEVIRKFHRINFCGSDRP